MLAALTFARSPLGMALLGAAAFALYTGFIWIKATNAANDSWRVQTAAMTLRLKQAQIENIKRQAADNAALDTEFIRNKDTIDARQAKLMGAIGPDHCDLFAGDELRDFNKALGHTDQDVPEAAGKPDP